MRDWPPPRRSWIMAQTWRDLLFAHWPILVEDLARVVPKQFELDLWNGQAWIGVVPFRMDHPCGTVPLPWLSATPEINVRTYVTFGGKRGVLFFSLDAANIVAVKVARRFFPLPCDDETVHYESLRDQAAFRASYGPRGPVMLAQPGTLDHWLTERYCFYTLDSHGHVLRGEIDHEPWPLQPAEAVIEANTMTAPLGIAFPDAPPLLHFAGSIDVKVWMPERCD